GLALVLAGAEPPGSAEYVDRCRRLAASSRAPVHFLPHLDPDDLADAYAAARVHALPSFYETVGLASLEAALGGCNVVSTANSGAAGYLGDAAWYCDPRSADSIRAAIAAAYTAPLRPELGRALAARYTWRRTAEETARAYEDVMRHEGQGRDSDHAGGAARARPRWLPTLPPEDYIAYLEDLLRLDLEATAYRDAQHAELQREYARLQAWARGLEEEHRRLRAWATELEAAARGRHSPLSHRTLRLLGAIRRRVRRRRRH
ncbi:MAG: glycosyltransferase, partial [Chloroflexota bacterium]|nr:glycosyltransferase [Chloroflexota bacterium]